jgi:hypothetical protein
MRTDARSFIGAGIDATRDHPAMVPAVPGDQFDASLRELFIERITVIGNITNNSSGSSQRGVFIERSFDKGDFMWASRRRVHGE